MMLPLILLATASVSPAKPIAIEAVELCTQVAKPTSFDLAPLAPAGWAEKEIENIDQAPGGAAANRMFTREGAGAVIMLNINSKNTHACHVLTSGPRKFIDLFERALVPSVGPALKLAPDLTFYRTDKKPFVVSLSRKPSGKDILADVMVIAFVPKGKAE